MFEIIPENLYEFEDKIKHNLGAYFEKYHSFQRFEFPSMVLFFTGRIDVLNKKVLEKLNSLFEESDEIQNKIQVNDHLLSNLTDWEIIDIIEDLRQELFYVANIDKFLRSTISNTVFTTKYEFNTTMRSETLENLVKRKLNVSDYQNEWVNVAKRNDLQEIDYTHEGGKEVVLSINLAVSSGKINCIIDNPVGDKIYGIDIYRFLTWENDDLKNLSYQNTIKQSIEILTALERGDVPEFLDFGRSVIPGDNIRIFAYSSLVRQMAEIFSSDDTLTGFKVKEFRHENVNIFMEFEISSRQDLIIESRIQIQ